MNYVASPQLNQSVYNLCRSNGDTLYDVFAVVMYGLYYISVGVFLEALNGRRCCRAWKMAGSPFSFMFAFCGATPDLETWNAQGLELQSGLQKINLCRTILSGLLEWNIYSLSVSTRFYYDSVEHLLSAK